MTTVDLDSLSTYILSNAGDAIIAFQTTPSSTNWTTMFNAINTAKLNYTGPGSTKSPQITVTMADGTVAYWSSSSTNTYAAFQTGTVSSNRNSTAYAMTALLSVAGVGYETFVSTLNGSSYPTIAVKYVRTGFSSTNPLGLMGVALTV